MPDPVMHMVRLGDDRVVLEDCGHGWLVGDYHGAKLRLMDLADDSLVPWEVEWGSLCGFGKTPQEATDHMMKGAREAMAELKRLLEDENA